MKRIKKREQKEKMKKHWEREKVYKLKEKQNQYGEYVHEFYLPKIQNSSQMQGKPKN